MLWYGAIILILKGTVEEFEASSYCMHIRKIYLTSVIFVIVGKMKTCDCDREVSI